MVEYRNNIQGSDEFHQLVYIPICAAVHEELTGVSSNKSTMTSTMGYLF